MYISLVTLFLQQKMTNHPFNSSFIIQQTYQPLSLVIPNLRRKLETVAYIYEEKINKFMNKNKKKDENFCLCWFYIVYIFV